MLLADLGARVIKIERPLRGDEARNLGPQVNSESPYFVSVNRGKQSITIDLTQPEGQRLAQTVAQNVDVFVENFVPGTMKRFGLDYATLKQLNPKLVYASISGFGQDGPYAQYPAFDIIVQAMGGLMSVTGEPNGLPLRPGVSLGDSLAGLFTALAIQAALIERERTKKGKYVDISMLDCQVTIMENAFARFFATGEVPGPLGSRHPSAVPFQAFSTQDGYIVVAILIDKPVLWTSFCNAIDHPKLSDDKRFSTASGRLQNYEILSPIMESAMRQKTTQEWLKVLSELEIPCGPVNRIDAVVKDPQILHRGMIAEIPNKKLGKWKVANTPFNLNERPQTLGPSPDLGEHTEEVLRQMLGVSRSELNRLRKLGVI